MNSLHRQYLDEIKTERSKFLPHADAVFTDEDLLALPEPVKRYFQAGGYIGAHKRLYGRVVWKDVKMRFSPRGKWWDTDCYEFLAAPQPLRMAHLKTRILGFLPIEAKDKYQCGQGNMLIRLARLITLQNVRGSEMDQSALVTFLSECLLLPAIALQPYIHWSAVSDNCALATISIDGTAAAGFFYFNDRHEFIRFETLNRWKALSGRRFEKTRWMTEVSDYAIHDGVFLPAKASASWVYDGEKQEYFTGKIESIL